MFRLSYDPAAEAVHDALTPQVSNALTLALAAACHDPLVATQAYGHDDKYVRMAVTDGAFAVLLIGHAQRVVTVLEVESLG